MRIKTLTNGKTIVRWLILECSDFNLTDCCEHKNIIVNNDTSLPIEKSADRSKVYATPCCHHIHEVRTRFQNEWQGLSKQFFQDEKLRMANDIIELAMRANSK